MLQPLGVSSSRELFPDGAFVQRTYLDADDDGEGVSLRPHGAAFSLSAVWRVHRVQTDGDSFVLLQGAAYGRYLAVAPGRGRGRRRAVQRDYGGTDVNALMWRPFTFGMGVADDDGGYILLRQAYAFDRNLRANGRYRFWRTAVTADESQGSWSTMMQWTVRRFHLAPGLPPLPPAPTAILGARRGLFRWLRSESDEVQRTIRHVRASDEGDFDQNSDNWSTFTFTGCSVFNLMTQLGLRQPDGEVGAGITLAVRPGLQGRLTPLVTDLPRSVDPMDIVVFKVGSQGAQNLVYPDIL